MSEIIRRIDRELELCGGYRRDGTFEVCLGSDNSTAKLLIDVRGELMNATAWYERDSFDCTPQQYHAGLDKLWAALGLEGVQDEDCFTLAAREIERLKKIAAMITCPMCGYEPGYKPTHREETT